MLQLSMWTMNVSAFVVLFCLGAVFTCEDSLSIGLLVAGHTLAMLGAVAFKLGYILRLEAQSRMKKFDS